MKNLLAKMEIEQSNWSWKQLTVKHRTSDLIRIGQTKFRKFEKNPETLMVKLRGCRLSELDAIYLDLTGPLLYISLKGLATALIVQLPYKKPRGCRPKVCDIVL